MVEIYKELANAEIEWWKAHHRRDFDRLLESTKKSFILTFDVSEKVALEAAKKRMDAVKEYVEAKKYDGKNQEEAELHWKSAEEHILKQFKLLCNQKFNGN